ncbi:MAG TPA: hypothetical protein VK810_02655, partial [Dongiaceae bacterium]|nr:hypothetical protein [Dongiaceae bacterium]
EAVRGSLELLEVSNEITFSNSAMGWTFHSDGFGKAVFGCGNVAGWLVAARFAGKSFGKGTINKSRSGFFSW